VHRWFSLLTLVWASHPQLQKVTFTLHEEGEGKLAIMGAVKLKISFVTK
jgi:hypothetical protein